MKQINQLLNPAPHLLFKLGLMSRFSPSVLRCRIAQVGARMRVGKPAQPQEFPHTLPPI
jgi:hypothetical protein